jgi:hypothetical protein
MADRSQVVAPPTWMVIYNKNIYICICACMHACMFFKRPQVSVIEVVIVGQTNHFLGAVPTSRAIMLPVALAHAVLPAHTISVEFKSPLRTYS